MIQFIEPLTQFGVAGLMGLLWVWERRFSRLRERQLTQTHERLMTQRSELDVLVRLVRSNTQAFARFDYTLNQVLALLEKQSHVTRSHDA